MRARRLGSVRGPRPKRRGRGKRKRRGQTGTGGGGHGGVSETTGAPSPSERNHIVNVTVAHASRARHGWKRFARRSPPPPGRCRRRTPPPIVVHQQHGRGPQSGKRPLAHASSLRAVPARGSRRRRRNGSRRPRIVGGGQGAAAVGGGGGGCPRLARARGRQPPSMAAPRPATRARHAADSPKRRQRGADVRGDGRRPSPRWTSRLHRGQQAAQARGARLLGRRARQGGAGGKRTRRGRSA